MARQWERVDEDTAVGPRFGQDHLQVSQRQHWRTHTDNGNAIFDSGRQPPQEQAGEMAFETAQRRESDSS